MTEKYFPIHQIPQLRDALITDEMEVQAANGGASARVTAASVSALGGPVGPTGPAGPTMLLRPQDFGAMGNGTHDDSAAVQNWLNAIAGGVGYMPPGKYYCPENAANPTSEAFSLLISSNTTIWGGGSGQAILYQPNMSTGSLPNTGLMRNKNANDHDINIYGVCFEGHPTNDNATGTQFVSFNAATNVTFRDCKFHQRRGFLLFYTSCFNICHDHCEFADWGSKLGVPVGGCTLDEGEALHVDGNGKGVTVSNCYFHDSEWSAILGAAFHEVHIVNSRFINTKEAAIGGGGNNTDFSSYLVEMGNIIRGTVIRDCQSANIEISATHAVVIGNVLDDSESTNINAFDPNFVNILGNVCTNAAGSIVVDSVMAAGTDNNVFATNVSNNVCGVTPGNTPTIGIELAHDGGVLPYDTISIIDNVIGPSSAPIEIATGVRGPNFVERNNNASLDLDPVNSSMAIPAGVGGRHNITVVNSGGQVFSINGDFAALFTPGQLIGVQGSTHNDGDYGIISSTFDGTHTNIHVAQPIPSNTIDGNLFSFFLFPNGIDPGLPFAPRSLQLVATVPSGGGGGSVFSQCTAMVGHTLSNDGTHLLLNSSSISSDSGGFFSTVGDTIALYDGSANLALSAFIVGYTINGFVVGLEIDNTVACEIIFTAYP